jgi:perosamine synthetase
LIAPENASHFPAGVKVTDRIPLSRPYLDEREEELVVEVLRSGRLSLGPTIDRFEALLAERVGAPYAAAVSSGTAGLHLLCRIAGLGPGDEAITSSFSFVASANCFIFEGATPVFADVDPRTLNLDPGAVDAAITERTKAVVAVDMFGYPGELDELRALCDRHGLVLVDDACEALGAEYRGAPLGSHGPSSVFAFYPNKQLATGEGGVVVTHSEDEWRMLRSLRNQGRSYEGGRWFHHPYLGFNYRWTDLQAAVGIAQLEKLDEILELRAAAAARYGELLAGADGVEPPLADDPHHRRSWFVYVVRLAPEIDRDAVLEALAADGIEAGLYVPCIHLQPYMRERYGFREGMLPVAEDASRRTLALPFYPQIEQEEQERVVDALLRAIGQAR